MRDPIQYAGVNEREKQLRVLALACEQALASTARQLTGKTAFASCIRLERAGLQAIIDASHAPLSALEFGYRSGISGGALWLMQTSDLMHLVELASGEECRLGEPLAPEAVETCLRFFSGVQDDCHRRLLEEHRTDLEADSPALISPDGRPAGLVSRQASYQECICLHFSLLAEPDLDLRIRLLVRGETCSALVDLFESGHQAGTGDSVSKPARNVAAGDMPVPGAGGPPGPPVPHRPDARQDRPGAWNIDLLLDVELPVAISFGEATMPLKDVVKLGVGSIIELDKAVNDPVTVVVNQKPVAKGEVVMVEGNYGVRILQVESTAERIRSLA